jgi:hypothetical protein
MIWGETLPSGRERAIEALVDMDPEGSFYRAARVLVRFYVRLIACKLFWRILIVVVVALEW